MKLLSLPITSALALSFLSLGAQANTNNNEPGSLLVFPIFDNHHGATIVTVTNTNPDQVSGTVKVHFVYVNGHDCDEFDRERTLTANDEITVVTDFDNPNMDEGYLYVYAKHPTSGAAIKFDHLIGTSWVLLNSEECAFEVGPVVYNGPLRAPDGTPTDFDSDGNRDLNGIEYEQSPNQLMVPRFFGQVPGVSDTELVLINLTGGSQFTAFVDFIVYNDNEEPFSADHDFDCWSRKSLLQINGVFSNSFLLSTNDNPSETSGIVVGGGYPSVGGGGTPVETGWYRIDGDVANSTAAQFDDPAILALQIERIGPYVTGMLPFTTGSQGNGDLLPHGLFGDNN